MNSMSLSNIESNPTRYQNEHNARSEKKTNGLGSRLAHAMPKGTQNFQRLRWNAQLNLQIIETAWTEVLPGLT